MDPIKEAFFKIKEDMLFLKEELFKLNERISFLEREILSFKTQQTSSFYTTEKHIPTDNPTQIPTHPQEIKGLKIENFNVSTGNKGVPTDKPTDRQTNQQTNQQTENTLFKDPFLEIKKAQELLNSLDSFKKNLRLKFKNLTEKEMLVFSTIYSLEEQGVDNINYRLLAQHLNLTESSIRDYTNKIIKKNIPLIKVKLNNKQIILKIPEDLKKIANLQTLIRLREI